MHPMVYPTIVLYLIYTIILRIYACIKFVTEKILLFLINNLMILINKS